ncbi:hypothetical protein EFT49_00880 [Leuconostoc falkenbergense]|uniref:hypothetical protein n=1 Tax=Leuconostoc falkenbergense TaxID=2766470 RepID=UPI0021AA8CCA|nr:hypothetical protein [Leuconostoc falkenbergense]MCT4418794.1 hypothetical protein [Leuconostoc falkenbergense]
MKKTTTETFTQTVTDSGNILIANFSGQKTNGSVNNVSIGINTVELYQSNKDKVVTAFDDFLVAIQKDNLPVVSLDNVKSTAESQSESGSTLESQSDVSKSESGSQSESESETDSTSDSTSDSKSALSQ